MSKETAAPIYAATVTGSQGQVVAKFRVKALKVQRPNYSAKMPKGTPLDQYPTETRSLEVVGLAVTSTEKRPFLVIHTGNGHHTLVEKDGTQVFGGYVRGTGNIFQRHTISVTKSGRALAGIVTHSCQRQSPHARFAGLWCPAFESANESNRRARK